MSLLRHMSVKDDAVKNYSCIREKWFVTYCIEVCDNFIYVMLPRRLQFFLALLTLNPFEKVIRILSGYLNKL